MCPHLSETQNCDPEPCYTWHVKQGVCIPQQSTCGVGISHQTVSCFNRNMVRKIALKVIFYYQIIFKKSKQLLASFLTFVGQVNVRYFFGKKDDPQNVIKFWKIFSNSLQNEYLLFNLFQFEPQSNAFMRCTSAMSLRLVKFDYILLYFDLDRLVWLTAGARN